MGCSQVNYFNVITYHSVFCSKINSRTLYLSYVVYEMRLSMFCILLYLIIIFSKSYFYVSLIASKSILYYPILKMRINKPFIEHVNQLV